LVPYSFISAAWNEPSLPVMPWTMSLVFSSIRIDTVPPERGIYRKRPYI
jgi:hypothetical protein